MRDVGEGYLRIVGFVGEGKVVGVVMVGVFELGCFGNVF